MTSARNRRSQASGRSRRAARRSRLWQERLEDRRLLAGNLAADALAQYRAGLNFGASELDSFWKASASEQRAIRAAAEQVQMAAGRAAEAADELIVRLPSGVAAADFAAARGMKVSYSFQSDEQIFVMRAPTAAEADRLSKSLSAAQGVEFLGFNVPTSNVRYGASFTPNDPYYSRNNPSSVWPGQWHLNNSVTPGRDARITGAWTSGYTGQGVAIGIVDDGLQTTHPDLSPNFSSSLSFNFGNNTTDPNPVSSSDNHGTSVAGVAAARGGNGIGVTGAAPFATLAGLRIDFPTQTAAMFADATLYKSSGADTSIKIKNHSYGIGVPYIIDSGTTQEVQAAATSTAAGTIHVFAAGNERGSSGQDANKKHSQSDPNVITVAAFGSDGTWADYSNFGANVFVTAPSSSSKGISNALGVTTTDRTGAAGYNPANDTFPDESYTSKFGGTSSATPLVAGVLALVKEAQPALNTRFAKHLLARTSTVVDANDSTVTGGGDGQTAGSAWKTNAAGQKFNQNYGFGLINAASLVSEATKYTGVSALQTFGSAVLTVNAPVSDSTGVARTTSVNVANAKPLEEVVVALDVTHSYRGDLEAYLTSPSGTTSRLMIVSGTDAADNVNWSFSSNAFWGESPNGTWTLRVVDKFSDGDSGTWNSWALNLRMGELVSVPVTGSISGATWTDTDGDAVWDAGETAAAGWTVYVDLNNDGLLSGGEPSAVTASNGSYIFQGLTAGTYTVSTVVQSGWQRTSTARSITLAAGEQVPGVNFGHRQLNAGVTVSISDAQIQEGNTGTQALWFTVTLSNAIQVPVTVSYATADGTATTANGDYVATSGTVSFSPGDPLSKTFAVTINGDTSLESNETFAVNLSNATGATISRAGATGTIINDDSALQVPPESNDTRATAFTLGGSSTVTVGGTIGDGTWGARDVDIMKIFLARSQRVNIQVRAQRLAVASTLDSYLRLFSSSGTQVARNDDYFGVDSGISYVARKAGWYYIGVSGYGNSSYKTTRGGRGRMGSTGEYELRVDFAATGPLGTASPSAVTSGAQALFAAYALEQDSAKTSRTRSQFKGGLVASR